MTGKKRQRQPTNKNVSKDTSSKNRKKVKATATKPPPAEPKLNDADDQESEKPTIREYVIKSPLDTNDYAVLHLPNGLKVFLVSTCNHERDLGDGQINSKTGTFSKVEEFNQKIVNLPPEPIVKSRRTCSRTASSSSGDDNDDDCSCDEPQKKKARMIPKSKTNKQPSSVTVNLAVGAGHLNNPADLPGLAHLCEHAVIFLGSKKYPAGSFFNEVEAAQGSLNASTFEEHTVFYFDLPDLNAAG
jgi:Insulinase (Peptidase family M16)